MERSMGQWLYRTKGREGTYWTHRLRGRGGGENRGKRKRFVFKWGLEVGEIDRLCLHTTEKEGDGEVCLTETGQGKEKQFIFMLL